MTFIKKPHDDDVYAFAGKNILWAIAADRGKSKQRNGFSIIIRFMQCKRNVHWHIKWNDFYAKSFTLVNQYGHEHQHNVWRSAT